jgi:uncharacterized protein (DUF58 family)
MTLGEVRSYAFGDDVRYIDWNVTARTGQPHIKVFEEERKLRIMLAIDISASSLTGSAQGSKQDAQQEIAALIAYAARQHHDQVGLLLFSDKVEQFIPPAQGQFHLPILLRTLSQTQATRKQTSIGHALHFLQHRVRKPCTCFIISDFQDDAYDKPLRIASRKHDITCIKVYDPMERILPKVGLIRALHPETGQLTWIDTLSARVREHYTRQFARQEARFKAACAASGVNYTQVSTTESGLTALIRLFQQHQKKSSQNNAQGFVR